MQVIGKAEAKEWFQIIEDGVPEDMAEKWLEGEATASDAPKEYSDSWKIASKADCSKTKGLNKSEYIALKMYTMDQYKFYRKFNSDCRQRKWKYYKVYTSLLQSGLSKLRRKSNEAVRKLYRGLDCSPLSEAATGVFMPCFMSTTAKLETAQKFGETITVVETRHAPAIEAFSEFAEQETLFSPFQVFVALADKPSVKLQTCTNETITFLL